MLQEKTFFSHFWIIKIKLHLFLVQSEDILRIICSKIWQDIEYSLICSFSFIIAIETIAYRCCFIYGTSFVETPKIILPLGFPNLRHKPSKSLQILFSSLPMKTAFWILFWICCYFCFYLKILINFVFSVFSRTKIKEKEKKIDLMKSFFCF